MRIEAQNKAFRTYKGAKIYRNTEVLPGADCHLNKDDILVSRVPKKADKLIYFGMKDGARSLSIKEVQEDINELLAEAAKRDIPKDEMIKAINMGDDYEVP